MDNCCKSPVQTCVEQIGTGFVPPGMKLHYCDLHGHYICHIEDKSPSCPVCRQSLHDANGTTASDITSNKGKIDLNINL